MNNFKENLAKINEDLYLNTSYPLRPSDWNIYRKNVDIFEGIDDFSMYVHIPFCKHLCKFCEYTKCLKQTDENENKIIDVIINDIKNFKRPKFLYGFDIGGGTPTCISDYNFKRIIDLSDDIILSCAKPVDFIASIEATFDTLTDEKIEILKSSQFKRISFGLQVLKKDFLVNNARNSNIELIRNTIEKLRNDFVINIDIMYGINGITKDDLKETIDFVKSLDVKQVTLYEMRFNQTSSIPQKGREELFDEYKFCYELLNEKYLTTFGKNTFEENDRTGVSSYLYYRMNGRFYKGFGPSAQSMSNKGITYNKFKNIFDINTFLSTDTFENGDVYDLPSNELAAKYICISLYQGKINLRILKEFYKVDLLKVKETEIENLTKSHLVIVENGYLIITKAGFKYYAAIGKLLYENLEVI